ncbi:SEL1-like repeat protein [Tateyamaria pelophila]|uniref:hypothetical protein n=1 Tax=Tateyamaria pelophila TaxID=328415 RepID=UPI001CBCFCD2|nr:hypothetical protein [Tateyamaria pelophila]
MKVLLIMASAVLFANTAFAQITERDTILRQNARELLMTCSNRSAEFCMRIGDGIYRGSIERDGEKVALPQSKPVAADFYAVACSKGHGTACVYAADLYMRLSDPTVPQPTVFAIARKGCALENGASCSLAGEMAGDGFGTEASELISLGYYIKSCEYGYERGCKLRDLTKTIVELTHEKDEIDQTVRDLSEAQRILSDPDLNK